MPKNKDEIENFKGATAATLKAIARAKHTDVSFSAGERHERPSHADEVKTTLPIPHQNMDLASITLIRGASDAKALRLKYHQKDLHLKNTPLDLTAKTAFDALEQARCEAIGANKMPGVLHNLGEVLNDKCAKLGYQRLQSREDSNIGDALHAMARIAMTGEAIPENAQTLIKKWKPWLDEKLGADSLTALKNAIHDQEAYAKASKNMLINLGLLAPNDEEGDHQLDAQTDQNGEGESDDNNSDTDNQEQGDSQAKGEALDSTQDNEAHGDADSQSMEDIGEEDFGGDSAQDQGGEARERKGEHFSHDPEGRYHIYTRQFDEIIAAEDLADPEELTRLRALLDQQLQSVQGVVSKLANRLQRKLMAQQQRSWQFDLEEGVLDASKLTRIITGADVPRAFKAEKQTEFRDTVVSILIDNSGSMRGRPIAIAALCADILSRTLERCGVKVEILGFTTHAWKGGKARDLWIDNGRPPFPGRLNDIRHIIYKGADTPLRRSRKNLGLMLKEGLLKENIDGEALVWAHNRLSRRAEQRKILMVISDGAPVDDSTLSVNPANILETDLRNVIAWMEQVKQVELTAIGIGHDVTRYYSRAMTISDADALASALVSRLEKLFDV
ncbi:MAG: cobaltochelatase subunit CobT [Alphaproteobacteria bacterium]|nr:cobaltochelatase subunit CobT [Alphaproteobacteria bacterium]NCQ87813.1 cobaltochelatase subunit CobT [Alphaproteobacteria bacterium]NCT05679.1 cobaltochelatase subunit CobT [Alphaproteobacteria bacterium]